MAKGQKRRNREVKKPKQPKVKTAAVASVFTAQLGNSYTPAGKKR